MQVPANLTGTHKKRSADSSAQENSKYRCVEVVPGSLDCCYAVQELLGKRFLSKQIPSLPLDACDAQDCQCSYEHLKDRRTNARRVSDVVVNTTSIFVDSNDAPRTSKGRRSND